MGVYVAEALLAASGVSFSSHSAVLSAYGQQFAKTRALDPRFHRAPLCAYSQRQLGDYAVNSSLTDDDIQRLMSDAVDFIAAARAPGLRNGSVVHCCVHRARHAHPSDLCSSVEWKGAPSL